MESVGHSESHAVAQAVKMLASSCGEQSGTGAGFSVSLFSPPMLIIPPTSDIHPLLPAVACNASDHAACSVFKVRFHLSVFRQPI